MPHTLLILTVGTGTAGRHSNIVSGLRRTIELLSPRAFWLVPSTDDVSRLVADEIRAGLTDFVPFDSESPYPLLSEPDDLTACHQVLRKVIANAAGQLRPGERLMINPTSGTKQMTAAAVLAALDEELGDIVFTTGERQDGVVKTGTEKIASFDPAAFFRERDLIQARTAAKHGAFGSAMRLLHPHRSSLPKPYAAAESLLAWSRQDYAAAASAAARFDDSLRQGLLGLARDASEGMPTPAILADLLAWSDHRRRLQEADGSLVLAYKCLELAARLRIFELTGQLPPYALNKVANWNISGELKTTLHRRGRNNTVFLGLAQSMQALNQMGDAMGCAFQSESRYGFAAQARNDLTHTIAPASAAQAQRLLDLTRNLFDNHLKLPNPLPRPEI